MLFPGIGACISQTLLCAKAIGVKGPVFWRRRAPLALGPPLELTMADSQLLMLLLSVICYC